MGRFIEAHAAWISLAPAAVWVGFFLCLQLMTAYSPQAMPRKRRVARITPAAWAGSFALCLAWVAAVLTATQLAR